MSEENINYEDRAKPFSKERIKSTVCRVIYFYSLFFVIMKIIAIFQGADPLPHTLIALPFMIFTYIGYRMSRQKNFSWAYIIVGIVVISAIRYYELDLLRYFQDSL